MTPTAERHAAVLGPGYDREKSNGESEAGWVSCIGTSAGKSNKVGSI